MPKVKLERVKIARKTKIKTGKGFFAQCQRCNNWVPMLNLEDESEWVTTPLIQQAIEEQRDNESDEDYNKRKEKAKWVCSRCWDELDNDI